MFNGNITASRKKAFCSLSLSTLLPETKAASLSVKLLSQRFWIHKYAGDFHSNAPTVAIATAVRRRTARPFDSRWQLPHHTPQITLYATLQSSRDYKWERKASRKHEKRRNLASASHHRTNNNSYALCTPPFARCWLLMSGIRCSAYTRPWLYYNFITVSFRPFRITSIVRSIEKCVSCRLSASRLRNIPVCSLFFPLHFAWRHLKNCKNFLLPVVRRFLWNALHADSWTPRWGCHAETHLLNTSAEQ